MCSHQIHNKWGCKFWALLRAMYIFHKVLTEKDVYNTEMEGTLPIFEECVVHLRREIIRQQDINKYYITKETNPMVPK